MSDTTPVCVASEVVEQETAISQTTDSNIPGERLIHGRVMAIRAEQIIVDIGNPERLYLPLKPAVDKGLVFQVGDAIIVTMNDHNAVVDYHHADGQSRHQVLHGQLAEPLMVGQEKAVVQIGNQKRTYVIASRARQVGGYASRD